MTLEEKKKCSEIWKMASGEYIAPQDWTDSAGDALASCLAGIYNCSKAMSYVPSPVGSAPGWSWVVGHVYDVLKNRYRMDKGQVFNICTDTRVGQYKQVIAAECLVGN
jgi:hypothetical protein